MESLQCKQQLYKKEQSISIHIGNNNNATPTSSLFALVENNIPKIVDSGLNARLVMMMIQPYSTDEKSTKQYKSIYDAAPAIDK